MDGDDVIVKLVASLFFFSFSDCSCCRPVELLRMDEQDGDFFACSFFAKGTATKERARLSCLLEICAYATIRDIVVVVVAVLAHCYATIA